jgi:OmpA-OmpF porin, OOP family
VFGDRFRPAGTWLAAVLLLALSACATAPSGPATPPRSFFVFFPADSTKLTLEGMEVIDRIAEEVRRINATAVGIVGSSSPAGTPARNLRLSDERAAAVEDALRDRGVPADIIVRTYQGGTQDLAGPPVEGRRVEVVVSREERR